MSDPVHLVYVTFPDEASARRIARLLVEQRLAACANIHGPVQSVYTWEGEVQEETEYVLILKTTVKQMSPMQETILAEHPYDLPCIVQWPLEGGHPAFLDWVRSATRPG